MGFIDTHSHVYEPEFDEDRDEVIARAKEVGVEKILLPNINPSTLQPMLRLCNQYPGYLFPMLGIHPEDVTDNYILDLEQMHEMLACSSHPFVAVGEVGLDYYWDRTRYVEQQDAFERQVQWAKGCSLPLVIHSRSAQQELVEIMSRHRSSSLSGIFHCFGGTRDEAEQLLSFDGFVLGIGGVLTFKKSALPDVLRDIPLSRIVVETDDPYLAPVPCRGKRNEPAFSIHVVNRLAEVYGVSVEEVMNQTNANVYRVFKCLNT